MKLTMTVSLAADRVTAVLADGAVMYDDIGLVVLEETADGQQLIAGIGAHASAPGLGTSRCPALSLDSFRPTISAGVVAAVAMIAWSGRHPRFHGLGAAFDRVEVLVEVSDFDRLSASNQHAFRKALPYHPQCLGG